MWRECELYPGQADLETITEAAHNLVALSELLREAVNVAETMAAKGLLELTKAHQPIPPELVQKLARTSCLPPQRVLRAAGS